MFRRQLRLLCGAAAAAAGPFNPYKILGVTPDATPQQIKKRYHELALRFHPDSGKEGNKERFQAVNEAYEAVKDGKEWRQEQQQGRQPSSSNAYGFDRKSKTYVYEQPGSTSDNYVSSNGRLQTSLRIAVVWCAAFFTLRFLLLVIFPLNQEPKKRVAVEAQREDEMSAASVHGSQEDGADDGSVQSFSFVVPAQENTGGGWR